MHLNYFWTLLSLRVSFQLAEFLHLVFLQQNFNCLLVFTIILTYFYPELGMATIMDNGISKVPRHLIKY